MGHLISLIKNLFAKDLTLCIVGLENAGKSTLLSVLTSTPLEKRPKNNNSSSGGSSEFGYNDSLSCGSLSSPQSIRTIPTLGINVTSFRKNNLKLTAFDLGGTSSHRLQWARYARESDVILFVVDVSVPDRLNESKYELHSLIQTLPSTTTPFLILCNKIDLPNGLKEKAVVEGLELERIVDNPWIVMPISALHGVGCERVLRWLVEQS